MTRAGARSLRVLVVDDHPLYRHGLVAAWSRERPGDAVVEAASVAQAQQSLRSHAADVAVIDVLLPDGTGLDVCLYARRHASATLPVMLSTYDAPAIVEASRRVGARGFFSKDVSIVTLLHAVERLLDGRLESAFPRVPDLPPFTERERDIVQLLLHGATNPAMARALGVSTETIKTHVTSVMTKLESHDRFGAAAAARSWGFDLALPYLGDDTRS